MAIINKQVTDAFFTRLAESVDKLTNAGYKGVHLDTHLQMVITEEQVKKHHLFYPTSPLVLITKDNCPTTIDEVEALFLKKPVLPKKKNSEESAVASILNAADKTVKKAKKKAVKKEEA